MSWWRLAKLRLSTANFTIRSTGTFPSRADPCYLIDPYAGQPRYSRRLIDARYTARPYEACPYPSLEAEYLETLKTFAMNEAKQRTVREDAERFSPFSFLTTLRLVFKQRIG